MCARLNLDINQSILIHQKKKPAAKVRKSVKIVFAYHKSTLYGCNFDLLQKKHGAKVRKSVDYVL